MQAIELHRLVEMAFNAGNADELADLYEDGATMATPEGEVVSGREDIRSQWSGFIALGGTIRMVTRYAIENDELALLSNEWFFTAEGFDLNSRTAEIARRQSDGRWLYVVDNPYGGADPIV